MSFGRRGRITQLELEGVTREGGWGTGNLVGVLHFIHPDLSRVFIESLLGTLLPTEPLLQWGFVHERGLGNRQETLVCREERESQ